MQKLLSEFQIKQFEDAAKEKAIADKANKFNSSIGMRSSFPIPTSTSSMVLRSATNAANFQRNLNVANVINSNNLANIPRGILNPSRNFVTPPRGFANPAFQDPVMQNIPLRNSNVSLNRSSNVNPFESTQSLNQNANTAFNRMGTFFRRMSPFSPSTQRGG